MVSSLPQRSENTHHVSMIENYPATLDVLGEPIRQVTHLDIMSECPIEVRIPILQEEPDQKDSSSKTID